MEIIGEPIYEGKSKALYKIDTSNDKLLMRFKDDVTAFNNEKHDIIPEKGKLNNLICSNIFEYLKLRDIDTHYIMRVSDTDMIIKSLNMIPIEVVVRNYIEGGLIKRLGLEHRRGEKITTSNNQTDILIEFFYKSDDLGDPLINDRHICMFKLLDPVELSVIKRDIILVNKYLVEYFNEIDITLVDFKIEFGYDRKDRIVIADDICPDGCRLVDKKTGNSLDKDIYRFNKGDLHTSYVEVYNRIYGK